MFIEIGKCNLIYNCIFINLSINCCYAVLKDKDCLLFFVYAETHEIHINPFFITINSTAILLQARINKRGRKLVDYDRYRHNLEVSYCPQLATIMIYNTMFL